jgi:pimeloyl-ACP methyl ester carboxylesterase
MAAPFLSQPRPPSPGTTTLPLADARGLTSLAADAVVGVTYLVEEVHGTIANAIPSFGFATPGSPRGIAGLVYRSVRGGARVLSLGVGATLSELSPLLERSEPSPRRDAAVAAINGLWGDHLASTDNPLAIPMHLRYRGEPLVLDRHVLEPHVPPSQGKLVVLLHGLCMNERNWDCEGHDHGAALARDLGYLPVYLRYNSGRPIATNGRQFALLLEQLVQEWPVPVRELAVVGHSMGGLVARSACHFAKREDHRWIQRLDKLVCLGTPHHGAPMERVGNQLDALLDISPYTAPFTRLGKARSAGIKDLRYGHILHEDEPGGRRPPVPEAQTPLPEGVACFAIAATKESRSLGLGSELLGDGLVPVSSALGRHRDPALSLAIPASRQHVCYGHGHFDLLSSREVYGRLHDWLADG